MFHEKVLTSVLIIGLSTIPLISHAGIKIDNRTSQYSTASINGTCSAPFANGITQPHQVNYVEDRLINTLCGFTADACLAKVYMTADCNKSGPQVATVTYSIKSGIRNIEELSPSYHFMFDQTKPFEVIITG